MGGDATRFRGRAAAEFFGQQRSARNGGSAAAAQKPGFGDAAGFETREEPEDVTANRIRNFDRCSGIRELAGVSRVAEVIENGFGEHFSSYQFSVLSINIAAGCVLVSFRQAAGLLNLRTALKPQIKDRTAIAAQTLSLVEGISSQRMR